MPMLTRAEWQAKPGGFKNYRRYKAWYQKNVALPSNPLAPWNRRQINMETTKRVNDIYNAQKKQLEDERASRVASIAASSQAASRLLLEHAPQVQGAYDLATREIGGLGAGYSDAMKARIQAAQASAADFASTQGAPEAPAAVDAQALADTAYHGGAVIPGSSLAAQGAAETALNTELGGIPLLQAGRDTRQTEQDYEKQLLELARQRPELTDKIAQQLFENELAKQGARIKAQAQNMLSSQFGETVRHHRATERNAANRFNLAVQSHQDAMDKAAAEGRQPNASLSRAYGYIVDKNGHPILDGRGKKIPVAKSTTAKSAKDKATAQYGKAVGEAAKMFADSTPGKNEFGDVTPAKRAWKWGAAIRYLMNRYGIKRAAARKALLAGGFKPPPGPPVKHRTVDPDLPGS